MELEGWMMEEKTVRMMVKVRSQDDLGRLVEETASVLKQQGLGTANYIQLQQLHTVIIEYRGQRCAQLKQELGRFAYVEKITDDAQKKAYEGS